MWNLIRTGYGVSISSEVVRCVAADSLISAGDSNKRESFSGHLARYFAATFRPDIRTMRSRIAVVIASLH